MALDWKQVKVRDLTRYTLLHISGRSSKKDIFSSSPLFSAFYQKTWGWEKSELSQYRKPQDYKSTRKGLHIQNLIRKKITSLFIIEGLTAWDAKHTSKGNGTACSDTREVRKDHLIQLTFLLEGRYYNSLFYKFSCRWWRTLRYPNCKIEIITITMPTC